MDTNVQIPLKYLTQPSNESLANFAWSEKKHSQWLTYFLHIYKKNSLDNVMHVWR